MDKTVVVEPEREGADDWLYEPTQLSLDLMEANADMEPSGFHCQKIMIKYYCMIPPTPQS